MRLLSLAERRRRSSPPSDPPKPPAAPEPPKKSWFAWSLFLNTSLLTALASVVIVFYVAISTYGKFVILPFEIRGELDDKGKLGESLAFSLSHAIEELSALYPAAHARSGPRSRGVKTDINASFLADLPLSYIPASKAINQQVVLTHFSVAGFDIPIGAWVFAGLRSFSHRPYVQVTLEGWGDTYIARIDSGNGGKFDVRASKSLGYFWLIDMIAAELSNRNDWLDIPQSRAPSVMYFTRGFKSYVRFQDFADADDLIEARRNYQEALKIDPNFALARLHLAVTQFNSWEAEDLGEAMRNLEALSTDDRWAAKAKLGFVAAILRYLDRVNDCPNYNRLLDRAKDSLEQQLAGEPKISLPEAFVLRASVAEQLAERDEADSDCRGVPRQRHRSSELVEQFRAVLSDFQKAERLIERESPRDYRRVQLRTKQIVASLHMADHLVEENNLPEATKTLGRSLQTRDEIKQDLATIPKWQSTQAWPRINLTFADLDLKEAYVMSRLGENAAERVASAERYLQMTRDSGGERVAVDWSLIRMAELKYSRGDIREAINLADEYFAKENRQLPSMFSAEAVALDIMAARPAWPCHVENRLRKTIAPDDHPIFSKLLLAELFFRAGRYDPAMEQIKDAKSALESNNLWHGEPLENKIVLTEVKLALERGETDQGLDLLRTWLKSRNSRPNPPGALNSDSRFDLLEIMRLLPEQRRPEELNRAQLADDSSIASIAQAFAGKPSLQNCMN
jgi:tetratricopeptide (TPR) repeat protein